MITDEGNPSNTTQNADFIINIRDCNHCDANFIDINDDDNS